MPEYTKVCWYFRPVLKCDFYWKSTSLQKVVKAYKSDYKPADPWMWLCIESKAHPGYLYHMNKSSLLLVIAYPLYIVETFTRRDYRVQIEQTNHKALHFPYQYSKENNLSENGVLSASSRAVWMESVTGVAIAATRVEETDSQKQLPSAEAITECLKMANETTTEDTGDAENPQSGRDDTDGMDNAPQRSEGGQACYPEIQACDGLSVNRLDMKLASVADVLGVRLMAAFVGGERYRG